MKKCSFEELNVGDLISCRAKSKSPIYLGTIFKRKKVSRLNDQTGLWYRKTLLYVMWNEPFAQEGYISKDDWSFSAFQLVSSVRSPARAV